jgi:phytoene dehydrogenase-like protein
MMNAPRAAPTRTNTGPTRHVYDVAVVGGQLSGAIAAALLARRGYQVLYVEHDGTGAGYSHDGWMLPYAPFVMPPLKALAPMEEVATELGVITALQRALRLASPMLQVISPSIRLDLFADPARMALECKRALGAEGPAFAAKLTGAIGAFERSEAFFREKPELPPEGVLGRFSFNRLIARHPALVQGSGLSKESPLEQLLSGLSAFLTYTAKTEGLAASRPLALALSGLYTIVGGREGLRELFLTRLKELGGDVLLHDESTVAEALAFDGANLAGLKLVRSDTIYKAAVVLGATDGAALRRLLPEKKRHRALSETLESAQTKRILFSQNWVIPERALPRGMSELVLWDSDDPELSPMLVQVQPARKIAEAAAEDLRVVCAAAFVPSTARELGEEHMKGLADRLGKQLETLMPFARSKVLLESAPYLHAGGVRGSRLLPHPHLAFDEETFLGITGLPTRAPAKHLFLASREVLPGLGFEGEVLTALRVSKMVQETLKKNDPLKRR